MCEDNKTKLIEFILTGFQNSHKSKILLFFIFFLVYLVILVGNLLIILLVFNNGKLHRPMYIFLSNLALADLLVTSSVVPNMLYIIIMEGIKISLNECIAQLFFIAFSASTQSCLLTVMSFDRYLAICKPLHYASIMTDKLSHQLIVSSWSVGFVLIKTETLLVYQLEFCTFNIIDHFFCDFAPLLALTTSDTVLLVLVDFSFGIFTLCFPFVFIIISYTCIFIAILKISTVKGKKKVFSTCSSHLVIVCTYYGSLITIYVTPSRENSFFENKFKSLSFVVLTPFINPIIYSLRNKDIKEALKKYRIKR